MDWEDLSVSRDRILSDNGDWSTYLESYLATPPTDPYAYGPLTKSFRSARVYKRCWDVVVPNWKDRMNNGEIITNDLIEVSLTSTFQPMLVHCVGRWPGASYVTTYDYGKMLGCPDGANSIITPPANLQEAINLIKTDEGSLRDEAVTAAYARVDISELEVLASLGEMPETVDWFRDVLKRLIAAMAALKKRQYLDMLNQLKSLRTSKGARKRAAKKLGSLTEDSWMEWRYAIRPLIFEVKAYLAALETKVEIATRKTARKSTYDYAHSTSYLETTGGIIYNANIRRDVTTTRNIKAGVLYSLNPELTGWWTHLGLDAPVSAAWAITRLSFVLDWFFNIGQWIASWEPRLGLTPLSSWVVETRSTEITGKPAPIMAPWAPMVISERSVTENGGYSCVLQVKARWANPSRQILPTYRYKGLNVSKVADLVVIGRKLASQLLR